MNERRFEERKIKFLNKKKNNFAALGVSSAKKLTGPSRSTMKKSTEAEYNCSLILLHNLDSKRKKRMRDESIKAYLIKGNAGRRSTKVPVFYCLIQKIQITKFVPKILNTFGILKFCDLIFFIKQ